MSSLPALLSDAINPILLILLLAAPFYTLRQTGFWEFWGRSALGILIAVALAESGKHYGAWYGDHNFPSGHETLGLAVATCLVMRDLRWLWVALPLTGLLAWALISAGYHTPGEVAGALLLGPPFVLLSHRWKWKSSG